MDAKKMLVFGCAGLVAWEAGEYAIKGEKPPLPAGPPHIHAAQWSTSASAVHYPIPIAAATTSTFSSSSVVALTAISTIGPDGKPMFVFPPLRGSTS